MDSVFHKYTECIIQVADRLETIRLFAMNHWFLCYRRMVYSLQTYRLHRLNLSFTSPKAIVLIHKKSTTHILCHAFLCCEFNVDCWELFTIYLYSSTYTLIKVILHYYGTMKILPSYSWQLFFAPNRRWKRKRMINWEINMNRIIIQ